MDTQQNSDKLIEGLFRLVLEYEAARSVLRAHGPRNWAALLHDYRISSKNREAAFQEFDVASEAAQHGDSPESIQRLLAEAIGRIVPIYPSQVALESKE